MKASGGRGFEALRSRDFRLLWSAQLLSTAGSQMMRVAIAWQLFELTRDPLQLGFLGLSRFVPLLLFGIWGGVLADRGDRRRTLMIAQIALFATSALLAGLAFADRVTPLAIYAATMLSATFNAVAAPTRQALIPALVPADTLAGAMAMNGLAGEVGGVLGPAVGGLVLGHAHIGVVYLFDAASFAVVAVALAMMRARPIVPPSGQRGWAAAVDGLRFLWLTPVLLGLMGLDFLANFFGASTVLMPIFAEQILGGGPQTLGLLLSAPAAGALLGSVGMALARTPRRPGLGVIVAVAVYGATLLGFGLSQTLWLSLLLLAVGGAADAVSMALRHTFRNLVTPDALRGRIAAAHSTFAMGGPQLGEFESGLVAAAFGAPAAVAIGGAGALLATAAIAWRVPAIAAYATHSRPVDRSDPEEAGEPAGAQPAGDPRAAD